VGLAADGSRKSARTANSLSSPTRSRSETPPRPTATPPRNDHTPRPDLVIAAVATNGLLPTTHDGALLATGSDLEVQVSRPELAPPPLAQQPRHLSPDAAVLQSASVSSSLNDLAHTQPPDLRSDSSDILFSPHTGTSLPDRSYGSLRLERDGRSKYVGPSANTAWIRDVSPGPDTR
jgi:hypothetical protein